MTKFFFNVRRDKTVFEDKRGGSFPNLGAAWYWALEDARGMITEGAIEGPIDDHWIEICDATRSVVATVPFGRVLSVN